MSHVHLTPSGMFNLITRRVHRIRVRATLRTQVGGHAHVTFPG